MSAADPYSVEVPLPRFNGMIAEALPRLRRRALALTRGSCQDADDLVNDTVVLLLKARTSYEDGAKFDPWAFTIMRHHFLYGLRRRREATVLDDLPESLLAQPPRQERAVELAEVVEAIDSLPPQTREAFRAVVMDDQPIQKVAQELVMTERTLKVRVSRARQHLREGPPPRSPAVSGSVSRHELERLRDLVAARDAEIARLRKLLIASTLSARKSLPRAAAPSREPVSAPLSWQGGSAQVPRYMVKVGEMLLHAPGHIVTVRALTGAASRPDKPVINQSSLRVYLSVIRKCLASAGAPFRIEARPGGYMAVQV